MQIPEITSPACRFSSDGILPFPSGLARAVSSLVSLYGGILVVRGTRGSMLELAARAQCGARRVRVSGRSEQRPYENQETAASAQLCSKTQEGKWRTEI